LARFFGGTNPLQVPEKLFHLGPPIVLIRLKSHFHCRFAVAGPVLNLRQVGDRLDEHLNAFPAAAAGHVDVSRADRTECRSKPVVMVARERRWVLRRAPFLRR
jgi:hypothetical protein